MLMLAGSAWGRMAPRQQRMRQRSVWDNEGRPIRGGPPPRSIACFWRRLFLFRSTGSLFSGVAAPVLPKNRDL